MGVPPFNDAKQARAEMPSTGVTPRPATRGKSKPPTLATWRVTINEAAARKADVQRSLVEQWTKPAQAARAGHQFMELATELE